MNPTLHPVFRTARLRRTACLACGLLLPLLAHADKKLTPPPELTEAEAMEEKVQSAENIPPEAKAELQQQFVAAKTECQQLQAPMEDAYQRRLASVAEWKQRHDDQQRRTKTHNANKRTYKLPDEAAALAAYNAEAGSQNAELAALNAEKARMDEAWKTEWAAKAKPYDDWRRTGKFAKFLQVSQAMLDGKIRFKKGKAWDQLVEAAKGAGNAHAVFENSNPSSNTVDARGVQPWAPGEREKELLKPRVQPYFQIKPAAEPPPPGK